MVDDPANRPALRRRAGRFQLDDERPAVPRRGHAHRLRAGDGAVRARTSCASRWPSRPIAETDDRDRDADRSARQPGRRERHGVHRQRSRAAADAARRGPADVDARRDAGPQRRPRRVTSLFVRGGESDYNKVLLDGVPLNEPGGTFYFSNLTTENLERIEILRGAYSSLFGSDAMASVIQLFTKRGDRAARGRTSRHRSTAARTTPCTGTRPCPAQPDRSTTASAWRDSTATTACRTARSKTPRSARTSASRSATRRRCDSSAAASSSTSGTPGPTAFGRPDLDAFFERHDGVGERQLRSAAQLARFASARRTR